MDAILDSGADGSRPMHDSLETLPIFCFHGTKEMSKSPPFVVFPVSFETCAPLIGCPRNVRRDSREKGNAVVGGSPNRFGIVKRWHLARGKVLRRTVIDHESQSALLLGYKGTGKSLVLDRVLRCLAAEVVESRVRRRREKRASPDSTKTPPDGGEATAGGGDGVVEGGPEPADGTSAAKAAGRDPFRVVYLNGMAQTDDDLAMREIVLQLGITGPQRGTYSSNLAMAVQCMKTAAVNGVPVIYVLDEFERFACRKTQTLLYALLDLCQDKSICAAVVGLSVDLNVVDITEKRIKSRFSFRQICFPREDFGTLLTILTDALKLPEGEEGHADAASEGAGSSEGSCEVPPGTNRMAAVPATFAGVSAAFAREFNAVTRHVLGIGPEEHDKSARSPYPAPSSVQSARADLQAIAASGRSAGWFVRLASIAVALVSDRDKGVTRAVWARAAEMLAPDPHAQALRSLSVTQMLLIVALSRLERRGRKSGCAFQVIFREYQCYTRRFPACPLRFSRAVMFKAFRQLAEQGLVRAAESGTGGREAHPMLHTRFRSRYDPDDVLDAVVKEAVKAPTNVAMWCKNWEREG